MTEHEEKDAAVKAMMDRIIQECDRDFKQYYVHAGTHESPIRRVSGIACRSCGARKELHSGAPSPGYDYLGVSTGDSQASRAGNGLFSRKFKHLEDLTFPYRYGRIIV